MHLNLETASIFHQNEPSKIYSCYHILIYIKNIFLLKLSTIELHYVLTSLKIGLLWCPDSGEHLRKYREVALRADQPTRPIVLEKTISKFRTTVHDKNFYGIKMAFNRYLRKSFKMILIRSFSDIHNKDFLNTCAVCSVFEKTLP